MSQQGHTIGLMGPWEFAWATAEAHRPENWQRVRLPLPGNDPAACRRASEILWLRRFFHRPTGLHPGDAVQLVFTAWPAGSRLWLNETPLGHVTTQKEIREVVPMLVLRNQLLIRLPPSNEPWQQLQHAHVVLRILPGKGERES